MCRKIVIVENNRIYAMFSKKAYDPSKILPDDLSPSHLLALQTYQYVPDVKFDSGTVEGEHYVEFESHGTVINRQREVIKPHTKVTLTSDGNLKILKESSTLFLLRNGIKEVPMKYNDKISSYRPKHFLTNLVTHEHSMVTNAGYRHGALNALRIFAQSSPIVELDKFDSINEIFFDVNKQLQIRTFSPYGV